MAKGRYRRFNPKTDPWMGGHLQAYIQANFNALAAVLGRPMPSETDGGEKVTTAWRIVDDEDFVQRQFTVYDYDWDDRGPGDPRTVREFRALPTYLWHIGGDSDATKFGYWLAKATGGRFVSHEEHMKAMRARIDAMHKARAGRTAGAKGKR